ncbi:MAG: multidrug transporter subunit MdtD [Desulfovibrio sp.]|nr:multidrug transporter subunit MdtD [Desulfovibrio sp.]
MIADMPAPRRDRILLWIVAVALFMQLLDSTVLNTALPGMARELGISAVRMHAAIIAYMLTTALIIPASGWLADRFGARNTFCSAICLFTAGSLFCALSPSLETLVISRVIQGMGGAIMVPVGRLAILKAYPRKELVRVLSFVTIPGLIGPLAGPAVGGFLVEYASWHWIFLINLPVGLVGALLAFRCMPEFKERVIGSFDSKGFAFFSASLVLLTLAVEGLGELRLPLLISSLSGIAGISLMAMYWLRGARVPLPLFSPSLFHTRSFAVGILGNTVSRLGSGAMPFLTPLFLQLVLGYSPFAAGMTMIPTALAGIAGKQMIAALLRRVGFRCFLTINTLLLGGLMAAFSLVGKETPYAALLLLLGLFGTVNSMQFTAMNAITLIELEDRHASGGNTLLSVTMQLSSCGGVAIAAALLDTFTLAYSPLPPEERLTRIFHSAFLWIGLINLITAVIFSKAPARVK